MKRTANIIQLVLTILGVIAAVLIFRRGAYLHSLPYSDPERQSPITGFEILELVLFWLWVVYSLVHLFARIVLKMVSIKKSGGDKKPESSA